MSKIFSKDCRSSHAKIKEGADEAQKAKVQESHGASNARLSGTQTNASSGSLNLLGSATTLQCLAPLLRYQACVVATRVHNSCVCDLCHVRVLVRTRLACTTNQDLLVTDSQ